MTAAAATAGSTVSASRKPWPRPRWSRPSSVSGGAISCVMGATLAAQTTGGPHLTTPFRARSTRRGGNDALTFAQLLERHERELFAYALRLSGQRADAEDLYQDTFLAAFRAWPPPRRGNGRAWLYKIATNRAIDRERRGRRVVAEDDDPAPRAPESA